MNAKSEKNLKALIFRIGPIGLGLLMIFLVAGGATLALRQSGMFAIQAIPLEWRERLDRGKMEVEIAKTIEADIGVRFGNIMGKRPWEIDLEQLGNSIRSLAWVADARLQRVFPDRLVVSISPKRPLAVVVPSGTPSATIQSGVVQSAHKSRRQAKSKPRTTASVESSIRPISYDGEVMPEWTSSVVPDVPFLRGDRFLQDAVLREKAVALIKALPANGILDRSNIAEIFWSSSEANGSFNGDMTKGFSILLLSPRTEIILGEADIEKKLVRVEHVLNYLSTQGKRARVIDSTSVKKVVVRAHHRP
ncbi:MAG: FtsQ-type POTRA domain-containing protein [Deltaproteobacteria bacterium]|nr:FtsQ-type POTRA domain-containing protein [Deltaproteobacteria bacterium]